MNCSYEAKRPYRFVLVLLSLWGFAACARSAPVATTAQPARKSTSPPSTPSAESLQTGKQSSQRLATVNGGVCFINAQENIVCRLTHAARIGGSAPEGHFSEIVSFKRGFCARRKDKQILCWEAAASTNSEVPRFKGSYEELASGSSSHGSAVCARTKEGALDCVLPTIKKRKDQPRENYEVPTRRIVKSGVLSLRGGDGGICIIEETGAMCMAQHMLYKENGGITLYGAPITQRRISGSFVDAKQDRKQMCALTFDGIVLCKSQKFSNSVAETRESSNRVFNKPGILQLSANTTICAQNQDEHWECPLAETELKGISQPLVVANGYTYGPNELVGITKQGTLVAPSLGVIAGNFIELRTNLNRICGLRDDDTVFCNVGLFSKDTRYLKSVTAIKLTSIPGKHYLERRLRTDKSITEQDPMPKGNFDVFGLLLNRPDDGQKVVFDKAPKGVVFKEIQTGGHFGCGRKKNNTLRCWGTILNPMNKEESSRLVHPPKGKYKSFALGWSSAVAIREGSGELVGWGGPYYPLTHPTGAFVSLRSTSQDFCAQRADGSVACWGSSFYSIEEGHYPGGYMDFKPFELPFTPASYALLPGGVCAIRAPQSDVECFGTGFTWTGTTQ